MAFDSFAAERSARRRGDERDQDKRERKNEGLSNAATRRHSWGGVGCRRVHTSQNRTDMSPWSLEHRCRGFTALGRWLVFFLS